MSEHEPDELGSALRVLAADASVPPTLSGGQIRRRGEARGRRRRAAVATAAVVVLGMGAAVGVPWVMDGHREDRRPVAIDPSPSSAPVYVYAPPRIDILTKVLTLRPPGEKARSFHLTMSDDVTAGNAKVAFKNPKLKLPALLSTPPDTAYEVEVSWAVNLSLPNGEALYLVADHVSGIRMHPSVLRMPASDAKWVYDRLKVGDTVTLN
ncbi:L,D-transpeptidase [Streptomyces sp. NBC_00467]|uniref:L,D-transpeptidase n=1 Tax=Streptomyces sp. NBC_00467 TaxID=2975752 RepID=UPI002E19C444